MSKKKIAFFSDVFYPADMAIAVRMHHLVKAFNSSGKFDVKVYTTTKSRNYEEAKVINCLLSPPSNKSGNIKRLFNEIALGIEFFFRVLLSERIDFILVTSPPFFASYLVSKAAKMRKIKLILDIRDYYPEVFFTSNLVKESSLGGELLNSIEKAMYKSADLISCATQGIVDNICNKEANFKDKLYLLRNGFDGLFFKPFTSKEENFTIVFHGNLGKFQDVQLIIHVAEILNEINSKIRIKIIGWGSNDYLLKNLKLSNLEYLGKISHQKIPQEIRSAQLGISFRTNDLISKTSFPVKVYEYLGLGIPIIITPHSEAGDFVEKYKLGFQYDPAQVDDIVQKIQEFFLNRELLAEYANNCIKYRPLFLRNNISSSFVDKVILTFNIYE